MRVFKAKASDEGKRADVFIASKFKDLTRSSLEKLFDKDLIKISDKRLKPSYRVKPADKIELDDSAMRVKVPKIKLPVVFEDENVLVVNKPEGVLTHSKGAITDEATVATFIKPYLQDFDTTNRAGIVHRLDRATSGVIITAKNKAALSALQKRFSLRKAKKSYVAIVHGHPEQAEALIDAPIERNPRHPQTFKVGANGKPAQTYYKVLSTFEKNGKQYSLLELAPFTGRTHQIRVHAKYLGTPVVGDSFYGEDEASHLYLHSSKLEITIPGSERKIFEAELPEYFKEFIDG